MERRKILFGWDTVLLILEARCKLFQRIRQVFWLSSGPDVFPFAKANSDGLSYPDQHIGGFTATGIAPDLHRVPLHE